MRRFPPIRHSRRSFSVVYQSQYGVTLLEVLVALGVLAALVTLSLAGSRSMREAANQTKCANQLRMIGAAMKMYANDHNQMYLLYGSPNYVTWHNVLEGYGLELSDCRCPSLPVTKNKSSRYVSLGRRSEADMDGSLILRGYTSPPPSGENWLYLNRIVNPASYVFWADAVFPLGEGSGVRAGDQSYSFRLDSAKSGVPGVHIRHSGKANVAFLDGRVETLAPQGLRKIGIPSGYDKNIKSVKW